MNILNTLLTKIVGLFKIDINLVQDNAILFFSILFLNISGYFFHFYMGRILGPVDYGILGVLMSILYVIIVPLNVIQTSITKFTSDLNAKNGKEEIAYLYLRALRKLFIYSIIGVIIFILLSPLIASFLKIPTTAPLVVLSFFIIFATLTPINRGLLQGMQRFKDLGASYIMEGVAKILFGILLVYLGFKVNGAIAAIVISYLVSFLLTLYVLRSFYKMKKEKFHTKPIYKYSIPVLITLSSLTALYVIDVVLVKHFFGSVEAGYYAAISLLGKVLHFGSLSISMVMFPKVSELNVMNKASKFVLYKSLYLVLLFAAPITFFYFLFPRFIIAISLGSNYFNIAPYIGPFALFMTLFSLTYILAFYNLSIRKTNFIYFLLLFNILEVILLLIFHRSIMQIIILLIVLSSILFLTMAVLTFRRREESQILH